MQFNRGDRVRRVDTPGTILGLPWNEQEGTITHLPGDPEFDSTPGWVWITWDNPALGEEWVDNERLERIA